MKYRARTLKGATARVLQLEETYRQLDKLAGQFMKERQTLAKLAATGPAFFGLFDIMRAKELRDRILEKECDMKPDGSPIRMQS